MIKRIISGVISIIGVLSILQVVAQEKTPVAKIVKIEGQVFIREMKSEIFKKASLDMKLTGDVYIRTEKKSKAELVLRNGSLLSVKEESLVLLNDALIKSAQGKTVLGACYGKMELAVKKLGKNESLEVSSPSAVLGVRGTKFLVQTLPDGSVVTEVEEGTVLANDTPVEAGENAASRIDKVGVEKNLEVNSFVSERNQVVKNNPDGVMQSLTGRMETVLSNASIEDINTNNFVAKADQHLIARSSMASMKYVSERIAKSNPKNDTVKMYYERVAKIDERYQEISKMIEEKLQKIDRMYEEKTRKIDEHFNNKGKSIDDVMQEKLKTIEEKTKR